MSEASRRRTAKRKADAEALKQGKRKTRDDRRLLLQAHGRSAEFAEGVRLHLDPADAVSEILDNIMSQYRYATEQVFTLHEDEYWRKTIAGLVPHEWVREQERLAMQAVHVAGKAAGMGLAERQVRLQEAQAAIFSTVVEAALTASGLDMETRRSIHQKIAEGLEDIEGTAKDLPTGLLAA